MKKIASVLLIFLIATSCFQTNAQEIRSITFNEAKTLLKENNRTLENLINIRKQALWEYTKAVGRASDIDPAGFTRIVGGQEVFVTYDYYTSLFMTKQKELMPEQMKYYWESASKNYTVTERSLIIGLRDAYSKLISSDESLKDARRNLETARKSYEDQKTKREKGLISDIQWFEVEYNFLNSLKAVEIAERNRENALRNFNYFIGEDIDTNYQSIVFEEKLDVLSLKDIDYYITKALNERYEIYSLQKQLYLKQKEVDILESFDHILKYNEGLQKDYSDLQKDIAELEIQLEITKNNIEQEITNAYLDIKQSYDSLLNMRKSITIQKRKLTRLQKQYDLGFITVDTLKAAEISLSDLQTQYYIAVFNYNTKLMKFNYAAGPGPAY